MRYFRIINIFLVLTLFSCMKIVAQDNERIHIRNGNKLYNDSLFVDAEIEYRKALDINPSSTEAMYNLGNTFLMQQKTQEAMKQYEAASKLEKNKTKLAKIYHNAGVILQAGKQYAQCIEAYKQSLRNNPLDHETRYNLALAQKMLKEQQQNQSQQNKQENQQDKQGKQNEQKDKNKDEQQKEQEQKREENKNQMSRENAEQLLNAVMQDEKNVQEKVKKNIQQRGKKYDKDW